LISDGRALADLPALAGFGRAIGEVGAIMIVGGNIGPRHPRAEPPSYALNRKGEFRAGAWASPFVLIALR